MAILAEHMASCVFFAQCETMLFLNKHIKLAVGGAFMHGGTAAKVYRATVQSKRGVEPLKPFFT